MFICAVGCLFLGTGFGVSYCMYKPNIDAGMSLVNECDRHSFSALLSEWFEKTTEYF